MANTLRLFDTLVYIRDGKANIIIEGQSHILEANNAIVMPVNIPYPLKVIEALKMQLNMIKEAK